MAIIGLNIGEAADFLAAGELVGIPTETVYGLAGNALDPDAVLRIFQTKNRPSFDPLIVHIADAAAMHDYARDIPDAAARLAEAFWPGPLTLLLNKREIVPDIVTSGLNTVAIRVPDHTLTLSLLQIIRFPLAAPSANPFGYISPTSARHVNDQLGDKIGYILDGGRSHIGIESTIVGFQDEVPTVYRLGGLSVEEIERVIGKVQLLSHSSSNPQAPGMLKSHYAPSRPVVLVDRKEGSVFREESPAGYLMFSDFYPGVDPSWQRILSPRADTFEAARNLFTYLRELDTLPVRKIFAELVPDNGLGRAVNDRLRRAAAEE